MTTSPYHARESRSGWPDPGQLALALAGFIGVIVSVLVAMALTGAW
ncbi:MAG: hypothetical protein H0U28_11425 [Nocardioidaceae bacterium]|nr:hypothetical protein [Nocardioidaceae bacterium]